MSWIDFVAERLPELGLRTAQHLMLTGVSVGLAVGIGIPLGIVALRMPRFRGLILGGVGILQTIPSLAMLTLLLAALRKIGALPAIIALTLYALLPIVRNTVTGLLGVSAEVLEAARGIGMTRRQEMWIVRFPLALPVIIAGVRTAAVTAVGIATLSAFIGAGGLGQFINRGLALADSRLILLGAIPAALLALVVDFSIAGLQWAWKPENRLRHRRGAAAGLFGLALGGPILLVAAGGYGYARTRPDLTIGSKNFTEQIILGHMLAEMIEAYTPLTVDRRFCLGGTMICHGAMLNGEIDMYVEYTGTGLMAVLGHDTLADAGKVRQIVSDEYRRRFNIEWMPSLGFNNTYAFAVRQSDVRSQNWNTISDLKSEASQLRIGFPSEFHERPDGYAGFKEAYEFAFGNARELEPGLMYDAIAAGEVDVIPAFSTDGRIAAYNLRPLVDDREFFPPYHAAPLVREATLDRFPQLGPLLKRLTGRLDDATMQKLNYRVDYEKQSPRQVAREFLQDQNLL